MEKEKTSKSEHDKHPHPHLVEVIVDRHPKKSAGRSESRFCVQARGRGPRPKRNSIRLSKALITPLDDNATIVIAGGERFDSHEAQRGAASECGPDDELEELRAIGEEAKPLTDGPLQLIHLTRVPIPMRNSQFVVPEALLCLSQHEVYPTRLFLSERPPRALNWSLISVLGRTWHKWSWKGVPANQRPAQILAPTLKGIQMRLLFKMNWSLRRAVIEDLRRPARLCL